MFTNLLSNFERWIALEVAIVLDYLASFSITLVFIGGLVTRD